LLEAMMGRRSYDVDTATAQTQVVGKRHFGLKASPAGGGGGRQATRELFDTLLLWRPRVSLDEAGEAVVDVPLNDSLTSFKLVAVATAGNERFGTGSTTIRTTQDLMILPAIAPFARESDSFEATATLRNTTDDDLQLEVNASGTGLPALAAQTLSLAPGAASTIGWQVRVPAGLDEIEYVIDARAANGASDIVRVRQDIDAAVPVRTFQAVLLRCDQTVHQPIQRPEEASSGRGGVRIALAPSLLAGLDGVREWAGDYRYTCLEQQVARAVILGEAQSWAALTDALPTYLDDRGLLKFFPTLEHGSEVLTAHLLALTHEAGLELPQEARGRMLEGLTAFVDGLLGGDREYGFGVGSLALRKLAAVEALARYDAARARMMDSVAIEPDLWPTSAVINWWSILLRLADFPDRSVRLSEAEQILRSRLDVGGTSSGFSAKSIDAFAALLVTPDVNPLRLILGALAAGVWEDDLPHLMKGAFSRQRRGAWDATVSNAWGSIAVRKFAARFEAEKVSGTTVASLAETQGRVDWSAAPEPSAIDLPWPAGSASLSIEHRGTGAPWAVVQAQAAIPSKEPLYAGYRIRKTLTPVDNKVAGELSAGDIVRVRLDVEAQRDMSWVVFDDPIPAGASHLGTGLARDSQMNSGAEAVDPWEAPAFVERSFGAVRVYYEYLPKGEHSFEYGIRLNQAGTFELPSTRVEALYSPEMFAELPNAAMVVKP
jgi:hypothetical protein